MDKILSLDALAGHLERIRKGRTVVHCHGVFDLVHIGHIRHFKQARSLGDILVVTLTADEFVNKGPHRPAFTGQLRAESLAALEFVDFVAINPAPTAVNVIHAIKPDVYVKGDEYKNSDSDVTGKIVDEQIAVETHGGRIEFTTDITSSSSKLINSYLSPLQDAAQQYLRQFKERFSRETIAKAIEATSTLRILTIGEAIIDEYHYCETLGKAGKEPILVAQLSSEERFAGGIFAVANHIAALAGRTHMLTRIGQREPHDAFIADQLSRKVTAHYIRQDDGNAIVKRRFVENYPMQKLFEVYEMGNSDERKSTADMLFPILEELLPQVDAVVVADYGHGLLDRKTREYLSARAPFLAVNTQANAGNIGFNTVSRYPHADLISISEKEARMEARSRTRPIEDIILELSKTLSCDRFLITQGKQGCLAWDSQSGFIRVPAFTSHVVDRVGAGDTVLATAALLAAMGTPIELVAFAGNVAGGLAVGKVCNGGYLDKSALLKNIISLTS